MSYTKEQIIERAKMVLKNSGFGYDDENKFTATHHPIREEHAFGIDTTDTWSIGFMWGAEEFGKSRSATLYISNKTGDPMLLVHTMGISKISYEKKENGDYISSTGVKFRL